MNDVTRRGFLGGIGTLAVGMAVAPTLFGSERKQGIGRLVSTDGEGKAGEYPLKNVRISARVAGRIAQVTIDQAFENGWDKPLEATYVFPLSGGASVSKFEMRIGKRVVRGLVKEREEAKRQYKEAIDTGKRASIMTQEAAGAFTVRVGNIMPGEEISVRMEYAESLAYFVDGTTEIVLPLVVAPRCSAGYEELPAEKAEPIGPPCPVFSSSFDPKIHLSIEVEIEGPVRDLVSSQHVLALKVGKLALASDLELMNRDFILRWRLVGDKVETSAFVTPDGYGVLSIIAPPSAPNIERPPKDVLLMVDSSGSMYGVKFSAARHAVDLLLATLSAKDRFALATFDDKLEWCGSKDFVPVSETALARAREFMSQAKADGSTELGFAEALGAILPDSSRLQVVIVLTDGQIVCEEEFLRKLPKAIGAVRVFTVGIDSAPNNAFLEKMAKWGGGTYSKIVPSEDLDKVASDLNWISGELGVPVIQDLELDGVEHALPSAFPDVFAGRSTTIFFRPTGTGPITVLGKDVGGEEIVISVTPSKIDLPAIRRLFGRMQMDDLEREICYYGSQEERQNSISELIRLSIAYQILTSWTAFIAVDEVEIVNESGKIVKVTQPVLLPDLWASMGVQGATGIRGVTGVQGSTGMQGATGSAGAGSDSFYTVSYSDKRSALFMRLPNGASLEEAERFEKFWDHLKAELDKFFIGLCTQTAVSPWPLERARKAAQEELLGSSLAASMPSIRKFLRITVRKLVNAVLDGRSHAEVLGFLAECGELFLIAPEQIQLDLVTLEKEEVDGKFRSLEYEKHLIGQKYDYALKAVEKKKGIEIAGPVAL